MLMLGAEQTAFARHNKKTRCIIDSNGSAAVLHAAVQTNRKRLVVAAKPSRVVRRRKRLTSQQRRQKTRSPRRSASDPRPTDAGMANLDRLVERIEKAAAKDEENRSEKAMEKSSAWLEAMYKRGKEDEEWGETRQDFLDMPRSRYPDSAVFGNDPVFRLFPPILLKSQDKVMMAVSFPLGKNGNPAGAVFGGFVASVLDVVTFFLGLK
eukprot:g15667.t1